MLRIEKAERNHPIKSATRKRLDANNYPEEFLNAVQIAFSDGLQGFSCSQVKIIVIGYRTPQGRATLRITQEQDISLGKK